jgi:outer membrane protein, heavy metal efflux system
MMTRKIPRRFLLIALICGLAAGRADAQAPTIDSGLPNAPGTRSSTMGPSPGSGGGVLSNSPGSGGAILGGRPGVTTPHQIPTAISTPGSGGGPTDLQAQINTPAPSPLLSSSTPLFGTLDIPTGPEDEGPADGLTLDQAIDTTLRNSLDLKQKFYEIPQAQADVLQASLRANPIFYADGQLLQYDGRKFNRAAPGGPSQYDVNVSYPLDLSRKRQNRTQVATQAKKVLESQYQDAIRLKIDELYGAYVTALGARQTVTYTRKSVQGLENLAGRTEQLFGKGEVSLGDLNQVKVQLKTSRLGLLDAEAAFRRAKLDLISVLNLPRNAVDSLDLRGSILDPMTGLPPAEQLAQTAFQSRPDVVAFRLGIKRAEGDVKLAKANRFNDVYVLVQPYTFQDNSPYGLKSAYSWALGATVPLPIYNRNQGAIERARLNVTQTQIQLADLERQVFIDVDKAVNEYAVTRRQVDEIQGDILPAARQIRDEKKRLYLAGQVSVIDYINTELNFNQVVKQFLDTAIRHRQSMLDLNTAIGQRILP